MIIFGIILGYAIRLIYFTINLAIRIVLGFIRGLYRFIAEGENPFTNTWKPLVGFLKFAAVTVCALIIWNCCIDIKEAIPKYRERQEARINVIRTRLHLNGQDGDSTTLTIAENKCP